MIGRIAPDQLGLNLPDRVFRLIGNKPRLEAGRPAASLIIAGDAPPAFIGATPYARPCGRAPSATPHRCLSAPRPTRARATRTRATGPRRRLPTGPYRRPALPAPVQQDPASDSLPAFIGARRAVLHQ